MSFFGSETIFPPVQTPLPGITTPQALYAALRGCWCAESCAPRMRDGWSAADPSRGQCSITAFLAQELFGGQVLGVPLPDGNYHCFNLLDNGLAFDLTSEQFHGLPLDYPHAVPQRREAHFARREKYERYLLLKQRLLTAREGSEAR